MKSVGKEKRWAVPEEVEIVDETNIVDSAVGLEPGVQTEYSGKTPISTPKSWERSAEPDIFSTAV